MHCNISIRLLGIHSSGRILLNFLSFRCIGKSAIKMYESIKSNSILCPIPLARLQGVVSEAFSRVLYKISIVKGCSFSLFKFIICIMLCFFAIIIPCLQGISQPLVYLQGITSQPLVYLQGVMSQPLVYLQGVTSQPLICL